MLHARAVSHISRTIDVHLDDGARLQLRPARLPVVIIDGWAKQWRLDVA
jgi:hypothetical protein